MVELAHLGKVIMVGLHQVQLRIMLAVAVVVLAVLVLLVMLEH
jgi:hypothetical protein